MTSPTKAEQLLGNDSGNRFELLLFHLGTKRRFGINVLKVKEVIPCPSLNQLPAANPSVLGVLNIRGDTFPIIHLSQAIRATHTQLSHEDMLKGSIITTEINRSTQGLWISKVDKIVVIDWQDVKPPSQTKGGISTYTTGITLIEDELVQIIDIEKVLGEVLGIEVHHHDVEVEDDALSTIRGKLVFIVDDSPMAVKQTIKALDLLGLEHMVAQDGKIALEMLKQHKLSGKQPIDMILSDIEMPEMDGYTFVRALRKLDDYKNIHVLMHTSLNGEMNLQQAISAGANDVLTKFVPSELAEKIVSHLLESNENN
jgi:two-component system, chemotaxis family, chemotaxis protein CheV